MAFYVEQKLDGTTVIKADSSSAGEELKVEHETGVDITLGRGETDNSVTYVALRNTNGDLGYITINADLDAIVVSDTKP